VMEGYSQSVSEGIQLQVGLVQDDAEAKKGLLHVQVSTVNAAKRVPMNIICLIDTSGSMGREVEIQGADGVKEDVCLNMLDLAKHAARTVAHGLNEFDTLTVIGWASRPDDRALVATKMNDEGHKAADKYIDSLYHSGSTAMIEALEKGFASVVDNGLPTAIFLLTDGLPNREPGGGFGGFVKDLMERLGKNVSVSTFGFGYGVDSALLMEIAQAGRGTFSFIPDAGLLGTVMVNALANTLLSALTDAQISIELCEGVSFQPDVLRLPKGSLLAPVVNADGSVVFNIGTVHYEQPRSIVLPVDLAPSFKAGSPVATVSVNCLVGGERKSVQLEDAATQVLPAMRFSYSEALTAHAKCLFADQLFDVIEKYSASTSVPATCMEQLKSCADEMKKLLSRVGENATISDIIRDCEGQACEAVSKDEWFCRWGRHYLKSLCCAHAYELCNNFKDPGVQHYGGEMFASIRDDLDDIFQSLPPPVNKSLQFRKQSSSFSVAYAPVSMSRFMDRYSGCFAGSCNVTMSDGSKKRVADVCKGDVLRTGSDSEATATVICIVEHPAAGEVCVLSSTGLIITPWHPIDASGNNTWSFPSDNTGAVREPAKEPVFTFVLDRAHSVLVNGVRCVTLAHGITSGDDVRAHPYFGSAKCTSDLQRLFPEEFASGHVVLPANCQFTRDPITKLVNGLHL